MNLIYKLMVNIPKNANWWTKKSDQNEISLEIKILYVLEKGTLNELRSTVDEVGGEKMYKIWEEEIYNKNRNLKNRNHFLKYFVVSNRNTPSKN